MGIFLMIWTARLAMVCYLARLCVAAARSAERPGRGECILWTAGCALLWVHILLAFAVALEWSMDAAYRHTAERTAAVTGWDWGGGLYVNFAVAALWTMDVAWIWRCRARGNPPPKAWSWGLHPVLGFVILNATVVFGPQIWRWIAAVFGAALIVALRIRAVRSRLRHQASRDERV
jgi:hypothetical protein